MEESESLIASLESSVVSLKRENDSKQSALDTLQHVASERDVLRLGVRIVHC